MILCDVSLSRFPDGKCNNNVLLKSTMTDCTVIIIMVDYTVTVISMVTS